MEVQILELQNKLPDEIWKIVSKFIGYTVHPTAEILKQRIAYERRFNPSLSSKGAFRRFLDLREELSDILATEAYFELKKIRSLPQRREAFIKLPRRTKNRLIDNWFRFEISLFNDENRNNRKFKKEQVEKCPMKIGFIYDSDDDER